MEISESEKKQIDLHRYEILNQLENWLEMPMMVLGFIWLALLIIELISGLSPILKVINNCIWIIFILDFLIKLLISPQKLTYIKNSWLVIISLFLPALRIFRIFRVFPLFNILSATRGFTLIQVIAATNRGMQSLAASMRRRGVSYVIILTVIVLFSGAAGMYSFENGQNSINSLNNYGVALWWTAMLMTTIGSEYWPKTPEGRILCFILSLYSIGVLGYITAVLATFFVETDAGDDSTEIAGAKAIEDLRKEILSLKSLLEKKD